MSTYGTSEGQILFYTYLHAFISMSINLSTKCLSNPEYDRNAGMPIYIRPLTCLPPLTQHFQYLAFLVMLSSYHGQS